MRTREQLLESLRQRDYRRASDDSVPEWLQQQIDSNAVAATEFDDIRFEGIELATDGGEQVADDREWRGQPAGAHGKLQPWWVQISRSLQVTLARKPQCALSTPMLFYTAGRLLPAAAGLARSGDDVATVNPKPNDPSLLNLQVDGVPAGAQWGALFFLRADRVEEVEFLVPRILPPLKAKPDLDVSKLIAQGRLKTPVRIFAPPGHHLLVLFLSRSADSLEPLSDAATGKLTTEQALKELLNTLQSPTVELHASILEITITDS
jgi:hypothetical protein